jgi:abortive infection bacteriophage resistance protein
MGEYSKPHLTHQQQQALMVDRGLACPDETGATNLLKTVGYYRLSAYVYPFRELMPFDRNLGKGVPQLYRSDAIRDGITFSDIEALWRFDRKLRVPRRHRDCRDWPPQPTGLRTRDA